MQAPQESEKQVRARFDGVATQWDQNPGRVSLAGGVVLAIKTAIPLDHGMRVMDFGAGTGLITLGLLPDVESIVAVDTSTEMLRVLDEKVQSLGLPNVKTLHCELGKTALPENQFDLLVSSMVLHHIPDVAKALQTLKPCLRKNGRIALADLDAEDGSFHSDMTGVFHRGFQRETICSWAKDAGFEDVSIREAYRISRPQPDGTTHDYPVFLLTGRAA